MTTNCIVPPKDSYLNRIFTTGATGFSGVKHIDGEFAKKKTLVKLLNSKKMSYSN